MANLAAAYSVAGKHELAIPLLKQVVEKRKATLGPDHPKTLQSMNGLGLAYAEAGQLEVGLPLLEQTLVRMQEKLGADDVDTLVTQINVCRFYVVAGKPDRAVPLLEQALPRLKRRPGPEHPYTLICMRNLVDTYEAAGLREKQVELSREYLAVHRKIYPRGDVRIGGVLAKLGLVLLHQGRFTEAEPLLRECLEIRQGKMPDDWLTFNARSMLGAALLGQRKHAEAEALLVQGYEGMKQREAQIPVNSRSRLGEALERVIEFYEASQRPAEAAKWRGLRQGVTSATSPSTRRAN
jgi:tetratricopeptide (TPR) repeat protein